MSISIEVSEIRDFMNAALDALEAQGVRSVEIAGDDYWSVPRESAFDLAKSPELSVGIVGNDIDDLREDMKHFRRDEGVAVWHMFHHLRGVVLMLEEYCTTRLI